MIQERERVNCNYIIFNTVAWKLNYLVFSKCIKLER